MERFLRQEKHLYNAERERDRGGKRARMREGEKKEKKEAELVNSLCGT